jgi:hypothetical protein
MHSASQEQGDADYIKTATQKARVGLDKAKTIVDIQKTLEDNLLGFFDKHLASAMGVLSRTRKANG